MTLRFKAFATKAMKIVLVALITLTCFTYVNNVSAEETSDTVEVESKFADVNLKDWSNDKGEALDHFLGMSWMADNNISKGYVDIDIVNFRPLEELTRSQMAAFLFRYAGFKKLVNIDAFKEKVNSLEKQPFTDIDKYAEIKDDLYYGMIWLAQEGISTGWDDGKGGKEFKPNENIKRADMAAFLYRLAKKMGYFQEIEVSSITKNGAEFQSLTYKEANNQDYQHNFADVTKQAWTDSNGNVLDHYYGMAWMASVKISTGWAIEGTNQANFVPLENIKRADMAAFLYRFDNFNVTITTVDGEELPVFFNSYGLAAYEPYKDDKSFGADRYYRLYAPTSVDENGKLIYDKPGYDGTRSLDTNGDGKVDDITTGEWIKGYPTLNNKLWKDVNGDGMHDEIITIAEIVETLPLYGDLDRVKVTSVDSLTDEDKTKVLEKLNTSNIGGVDIRETVKDFKIEGDKCVVIFKDDSSLKARKCEYIFNYTLYFKFNEEKTELTLTNKSEGALTRDEYLKQKNELLAKVTKITVEQGTKADALSGSGWGPGLFGLYDGYNSECTIDFTNLDTSEVTSFDYLFGGMNNLGYTDSDKNVTKNLEIIGLDKLNTNNLRGLNGTFAYSSLKDDYWNQIKYWNTSNVSGLDLTFTGSNLTKLDAVSKWDVSKVCEMDGTFARIAELSDLTPLKDWKLSSLTTNWVGFYSSIFSGSNKITTLNGLENWGNYLKENCKSFQFADMGGLTDINAIKDWDVSNMSTSFSYCTSLKDLTPLSNWNVSNWGGPDGHYSLFEGCKSLENLTPLKNWDTTNWTYWKQTFANCTSLKNFDGLQNWKFTNANLPSVFRGCNNVESLIGLEGVDVPNLNDHVNIDLGGLFKDYANLTDISALSSWDTSKVRTFESMFENCTKLPNIKGLENFKFDNANNLQYMFKNCTSLNDLSALNNWDLNPLWKNTNNVEEACKEWLVGVIQTNFKAFANWKLPSYRIITAGSFGLRANITSLDGVENWNVPTGDRFEGLREYFINMDKLSDIKALASWDVSEVQDCFAMFAGCTSLTDISALKDWNLEKCTNIHGMFGAHFNEDYYNRSIEIDYIDGIKDYTPLENWKKFTNFDVVKDLYERCKNKKNVSWPTSWGIKDSDNTSN